MRAAALCLGLVILWGCPSATVENPDAGPADTGVVRDSGPADTGVADTGVEPDAGPGHQLTGLNLAPALGASNSDGHRVRGGLRAASGTSESDKHRMRGHLAPMGP